MSLVDFADDADLFLNFDLLNLQNLREIKMFKILNKKTAEKLRQLFIDK